MNTSNITNISLPSTRTYGLSSVVMQAGFSTISVLSILGNLLVLLVLYKRRKSLLKKSFYTLTLVLSVCDLVTGVLLFISPRHLFLFPVLEPSSGTFALAIYCELIWSNMMLFVLGRISIFICLTITIDRWVAIVKPSRYKRTFTGRRISISVLCGIVSICLFVWFQRPTINQEPQNHAGRKCAFGKSRSSGTRAASIAGVFIFISIPSLMISVLYAHMLYKYKTSSIVALQHGNAARKRITIIAALTSFTLIACWLPNQTIYLLFNFGKVRLGTYFHDFSTLLAMFNSAVNPFLYGLASGEYRKGYWEILTSCFAWVPVVKELCCRQGSIDPTLPDPSDDRGIVLCTAYIRNTSGSISQSHA